ncbi:hypothetical protein DPMN_133508 [Dreissena polymorpha]|uniref:Uncharacterized protein n=1 Tax=Dreissena polymorpha TaxID=45954 RepID=A0A9D4FY15_DREPO|nr:hypothetical protein DPMN_133508 [Dreissena polymorpha]
MRFTVNVIFHVWASGFTFRARRFSKNLPSRATPILTKFHEDWTINEASREKCTASGGHVFKATKTIFELIQDINGTNLLTKFHDNRQINVTYRVLTRKNAPPLGSHVFQANVTIFELIQDIIETNLLTKFHEDWTINVASRELTRQMLTSHNGQRTKDNGQKATTKAHHEA